MSNPRIKHTGKITKTDNIDGIGDFMRAVWQDFKVENRGLYFYDPRQERRARLSQDLQKIKDMSDAECDQAAKAEFKNERRKLRARITRHANIHHRLLKAEHAISAFNVASGDENVSAKLSGFKNAMQRYLGTRKSWAENDVKNARHELNDLSQQTGAEWRKRQIDQTEWLLKLVDCNPTAGEMAVREKALDVNVEKRIARALKKVSGREPAL